MSRSGHSKERSIFETSFYCDHSEYTVKELFRNHTLNIDFCQKPQVVIISHLLFLFEYVSQ